MTTTTYKIKRVRTEEFITTAHSLNEAMFHFQNMRETHKVGDEKEEFIITEVQ